MGLSLIIATGPRQRSQSQIRVPRDSWPHFALSNSRLSRPGGRCSLIHIPPETRWPSYTPSHWVPFLSPPTSCRATVEIFNLAFTRDSSKTESESYVTSDSQSASLSWNKAPIWGLRPDIYYFLTITVLQWWSALSDDRTGLSFGYATGPRQRSASSVGVILFS
jgi:hypothetical protein